MQEIYGGWIRLVSYRSPFCQIMHTYFLQQDHIQSHE